MAWIKMRSELLTHPKVVRILSAIRPHEYRTDVQNRSDKFRVIGGLHAVWSIFDQHSEDGVLVGYTPEMMDDMIGWNGFSEAMILVDWLHFDGDQTLVLPDFDAHNSQSAKRRAEDQKRKEIGRKSDKRQQSVRNLSANDPHEDETEGGLEKEKEKSKPTHIPGVRAQIAMTLRKYTISANPSHPTVIAMEEQGIDLEVLDACCKETREAKPNETISIGYIAKKLEGWARDAAAVKVAGASDRAKRAAEEGWRRSPKGIEGKASQLGIYPRAGESHDALRERCEAEIRRRAQEVTA